MFKYNEEKSDYNNIINKLNKILTDLKERQINAYQKEPLIRYIYGRQFKYLYDYFNNIGNLDIKPLLSYIINNSDVQEIKEFSVQENLNKEEVAENLIIYCKTYLDKTLGSNDLSKIYQNSLIKQEYKMKERIYMYYCDDNNSKNTIYQFFAKYTGGEPIAQNILLFNKEITIEELTAFIYRAILCKYETLFVIENGDYYNNEMQNFMYDLLEELYNKNVDIMESSIMIEIVSSDSPGVGKSTYIINYIKKRKRKEYISP